MSTIETSTLMEKLRSKLHFVRDRFTRLTFSNQIVGIIDVGLCLVKPKCVWETILTTGAGETWGMTVPEGKRWTVLSVDWAANGTATIVGWMVRDKYDNNILMATVEGCAGCASRPVLDEGTQCGLTLSAWTSGTCYLRLYVLEEELEG